MTIDDSTLAERTFTATHDRILHALVEQVHDMGLRLNALEAVAGARVDEPTVQLAPPTVPKSAGSTRADAPVDDTSRRDDAPIVRMRPNRPTGWQPTRR